MDPYEDMYYLHLKFSKYGIEIGTSMEEVNLNKIFKIDDEGNGYFEIKITVPKDTHLTDDDGIKMCGKHLAEVYKNDLQSKLNTKIKVLFKERDEVWDKQKEELKTLSSMLAIAEIKKRGGKL